VTCRTPATQWTVRAASTLVQLHITNLGRGEGNVGLGTLTYYRSWDQIADRKEWVPCNSGDWAASATTARS